VSEDPRVTVAVLPLMNCEISHRIVTIDVHVDFKVVVIFAKWIDYDFSDLKIRNITNKTKLIAKVVYGVNTKHHNGFSILIIFARDSISVSVYRQNVDLIRISGEKINHVLREEKSAATR
jgi:hypothetical protein